MICANSAYEGFLGSNSISVVSKHHSTHVKRNRVKALSNLSLSTATFFLETASRLNSRVSDLYSLATFKRLRYGNLGIFKLLKQAAVSYMEAEPLKVKDVPAGDGLDPYCFSRPVVLRGYNALLRCIDKGCDVPHVFGDFLKKKSAAHLDRRFITIHIRCILERRNFRNMDIVFPIVTAFIYCATRSTIEAPMTEVDSKYSGLLAIVMSWEFCIGLLHQILVPYLRKVAELKTTVLCVFQKHGGNFLTTLKFHMPAHLRTDLEWSGDLEISDDSRFNRYIAHIKLVYVQTSERLSMNAAETVAVMNRELD